MRRPAFLTLLAVAFLWSGFAAVQPATAQYFGRNKVQYDDFDFEVFRTEHFEIYYYPEEREAIEDVARMAERWYRRHSRTFLREFRKRKPLIFYANDADFQQTNVIGGFIGEGTGGVTEGLKQRVVMPLTGMYSETDHVLGHELVHSFQYDIAFSSEDTTRFAINLLPLWMVEGMAEYLSVGRVDPHTAMWLRDAAMRDDLPTTDQLTRDMRYFPYRYGQAYMAYIGGKYGDAAVTNLYKLSGRAGVDSSIVYTLGITPDSLSKEWIASVKDTYLPLMEGRTEPDSAGRLVLAPSLDGGNLNIAPSISPDGRWVAFISERDLFSINLFIADAETGEVVKKLKGPAADPHFDALRFINSSGTWSPDGERLAFVTFAEGDNEIAILDVDSRDVERHIKVKGVSAITNPAWSPDGKYLAFSGMNGGLSDLYVLDLETRAVRQLTNDRYADLQPTWSPDSRHLAFTTDRGPDGIDFQNLEYAEMRLATIDVESGDIQVYRPFGASLHHNPQFSPDGRSLFFISDQDGFKDVYRLALQDGQVYRVTYLKTGISGISKLSPAMSVAQQNGRMMFSVFSDNEYNVFALEQDETQGEPLTPAGDDIATAGILPPVFAVNSGLVSNYLDDPQTGLPPAGQDLSAQNYDPKLRLDYVAPPSIGVAAGGPFGTQVGGGVGFFFSDMLGNQNLTVVAQANGTLKDIGAQVQYLNIGGRINYGAAGGHIPILFGSARRGFDSQTGVQIYEQLRQRIYIDQLSGLATYPLTTTRRFEASAGFIRYGFDYEIDQYLIQGGLIQRDRFNADDGTALLYPSLQEPDAIYFFQGSAAYVGDYSFFGFTSPIKGARYRFQASPQIGTERYATLMADYRRYLFADPVTFAFRGLHIGNYGANEADVFGVEYLGSSYRQGFVRGYSFNSFDYAECTTGNNSGDAFACPELERLQGTRIALASAELRIPLFGTKQFGLINFPYLPTELSFFTDAGLAWTADEAPTLTFDRDSPERVPVVSTGVSTRINVLGYMIFEIFYAYPFQRPERGAHFGFQLSPGW